MKFLASNLDLVLGRPYKFSISEKEYQLTFNVRITWKKICDIIMFPIFWRYFFICTSLNPFLGFKIITFEGLAVNSVSPDGKGEKTRIRTVDGQNYFIADWNGRRTRADKIFCKCTEHRYLKFVRVRSVLVYNVCIFNCENMFQV